jgi:hypothetical protein
LVGPPKLVRKKLACCRRKHCGKFLHAILFMISANKQL